MDVVNKIYIDWKQVDQLVTELAIGIQLHCPDIIYIHGIARGGLVPAVMLSHLTGIPLVEKPDHFKFEELYRPSDTLIVDDIADSGKTLKTWSDYRTAVLHYKPHTSFVQPTLWSKIHKTDDWIIYPWERKDSKTIQDYKLDN